MPLSDLTTSVRLADLLLREHGLTEPPIPVDLLHRFDHRPIHIYQEPLHPGLRGASKLVNGSWIVLLNSQDSIEEQRLTTFHEGWHILAGQGIFLPRYGAIASYECGHAEFFAAHILMPTFWLLRQPEITPAELALACGVTLAAAARRLCLVREHHQAVRSA